MTRISRVRGDVAPVAIYDRVREDLRNRLRSAEWKKGEKLPGRTRLAKEYGVDTGTLQRAISALLTEGVLIADPRRGTFVPESVEHAPTLLDAAEYTPRGLNNRPVVALLGPTGATISDRPTSSRFWLPAIEEIEARLSAEGYTLQFFSRPAPDRLWEQTSHQLRLAIEQGLAAAVFVGAEPDNPCLDQAVDFVHEAGIPAVTVSDGELPYEADQVFFDHRRLGSTAAQRLLRAGHQTILFIATHDVAWVRLRTASAREAVRQFGLPESVFTVAPKHAPRPGDIDPDFELAGYAAGKSFLASGNSISGVIGANDLVAAGFIRAAAEIGMTAGIDYNIMGFDGDEIARAASLSTFQPPVSAMGTEAARILLRAMGGRKAKVRVELSSEFISRSSTQPIPGLVARPLRYSRQPETDVLLARGKA